MRGRPAPGAREGSPRHRRARGAAALAWALALGAPLTLTATPASATAPAFCQTLALHHVVRPVGVSTLAWHKWATTTLPVLRTLYAEAPPFMYPRAINGLVNIAHYASLAPSYVDDAGYISRHPVWWTNGWNKLTADLVYCSDHNLG